MNFDQNSLVFDHLLIDCNQVLNLRFEDTHFERPSKKGSWSSKTKEIYKVETRAET